MKNKVEFEVHNKDKATKETPEERAERIRLWSTTRTRVVPSKKVYNRKKFKEVDSND